MKRLFTTATALMFALGLTVAAQAQTAVDKSKTTPAPVQKVATQETGKIATKTDDKKVEPGVTGVQEAADKGQKGKDVKKTAAPEKKSGLDTPKTDKK